MKFLIILFAIFALSCPTQGTFLMPWVKTTLNPASKSAVLVLSTSNFMTLDDLQGKKLCANQYLSEAYNTFEKLLKAHRPSLEARIGRIVQFIREGCAPEAWQVFDKLCRMCKSQKLTTANICTNDLRNEYAGDVGALRCLSEIGDFAVVDLNVLSRDTTINTEIYKQLCSNGSIAKINGFEVDDKCVLSNKNIDALQKQDTSNANNKILIFFGLLLAIFIVCLISHIYKNRRRK